MRIFLKFIINPQKYFLEHRELKKGLKPFLITLLISIFLLHIVNMVFTKTGFPASSNQLEKGILSKSAMLLILLLAPLLEELLFRLPLRPNINSITIGVSLLVGTVISFIITQYLGGYSYNGIPLFQILSLLLSLPIFLSIKKALSKNEQSILLFVHKRYNLLFFLLLILFISSHYLNYKFQSIDFTYALYLFIVYLIYGYSLSLIRISQGIKRAIILHYIFLIPAVIRLIN